MTIRHLQEKGFTLVELIVVVAFLSILMAIAIPNYLNFQKKAKATEARSNLGAIRSAMTAHYAENSTYNIGNLGTIVLTTADNNGSPFGQSSTAIGLNKPWDPGTCFSVVGFNAEGAVYMNYSLETADTSFTAMASADLDRDSQISHYYLSKDSTTIAHIGDDF